MAFNSRDDWGFSFWASELVCLSPLPCKVFVLILRKTWRASLVLPKGEFCREEKSRMPDDVIHVACMRFVSAMGAFPLPRERFAKRYVAALRLARNWANHKSPLGVLFGTDYWHKRYPQVDLVTSMLFR